MSKIIKISANAQNKKSPPLPTYPHSGIYNSIPFFPFILLSLFFPTVFFYHSFSSFSSFLSFFFFFSFFFFLFLGEKD